MNKKRKVDHLIKSFFVSLIKSPKAHDNVSTPPSPAIETDESSVIDRNFSQRGSASSWLIMLGAMASIGIMHQTGDSINEQLNFLNVKRVKIEGQESTLYGLSIAEQLLKGSPTHNPAVGFKNPVNPSSLSDIALRYIESNPNSNVVSLEDSFKFRIKAPNLLQSSSNSNFAANSNPVDVIVKPFNFEPFATGYGVKSLLVAADVQVANQKFSTAVTSKAKLNLTAPPGSCVITASSGGAPVSDGALLPFGSVVDVNLKCTGVILSATIFDGGNLLSSVGPVTQANDYGKTVTALLPPALVAGSWMHGINAIASLVDGSPVSIASLTFTIANPPPPPPPPAPLPPPVLNNVATAPTSVSTTPAPASAAPNINPNGLLILSRAVDNREALAANKAGIRTDMTIVTNKKMDFLAGPGEKIVGIKPPGGTGGDRDYYAINTTTGQMTPIGTRDTLGTGCIREGSLILVAPDTLIRIENLRAGDYIYNPKVKKYSRIEELIAGPEKKPLVSMTIAENVLELTETHPVATLRGYIPARDVVAGKDKVWWLGDWHTVDSVNWQSIPGWEKVWNLSLQGGDNWDAHLFEANGFLVGDLEMQRTIEKQGAIYGY